MRTRILVFLLLVGALALLGFHRHSVPVPDHLGTSRDWTAPDNEALFRAVEGEGEPAYAGVLYDELGRESYGR